MEINKKYYEERNNVKEFILNFKQDQCISNFFEYLYLTEGVSDFEFRFLDVLQSNIGEFYDRLISKELEYYSVQQLKDKIIEGEIAGIPGFINCDYEEIIKDLKCRFSEGDFYYIMFNFMIDMYEETISNIDYSEKQEKICNLREKIAQYESQIEELQRNIKINLNKINELNQ